VLRVKIDFPLGYSREQTVGDRELLPYLDSRVGDEIGVNFTVLENEGQMTLEMESEGQQEPK